MSDENAVRKTEIQSQPPDERRAGKGKGDVRYWMNVLSRLRPFLCLRKKYARPHSPSAETIPSAIAAISPLLILDEAGCGFGFALEPSVATGCAVSPELELKLGAVGSGCAAEPGPTFGRLTVRPPPLGIERRRVRVR